MALKMTVKKHIGLLTLHGKAGQIAPAFMSSFASNLVLTTDFDTDLLGSFTGEPPRLKTPQECAIEKASLAADLTSLDAGIGSEGSFGPGPYGLGIMNRELIAYVDTALGFKVLGQFNGPILVKGLEVNADERKQLEEAELLLSQVPAGQGLVLQLADNLSVQQKGLSVDEVRSMLPHWLAQGTVKLSYDLRAHQCPARQVHIIKAAQNLVERLKCECPKCSTPGFWPEHYETGLPCELCNTPTEKIKHRIAKCQHCLHTDIYQEAEAFAQPDYCPRCNP